MYSYGTTQCNKQQNDVHNTPKVGILQGEHGFQSFCRSRLPMILARRMHFIDMISKIITRVNAFCKWNL